MATVPAGETWLIKTISIYNGSGSSAVVTVRLLDSVLGQLAYLVSATYASGFTPAATGYYVADAGVTLEVNSANSSVYLWISGTRLQG